RVNQSHIQCLLSTVLTTEIPDLAGFLVTNHTCHVGCTPTRIETTNFRTSLTETRILSGNREITEQVEHMTTANGVTCNHGDNWLREVLNRVLQFKCVQ